MPNVTETLAIRTAYDRPLEGGAGRATGHFVFEGPVVDPDDGVPRLARIGRIGTVSRMGVDQHEPRFFLEVLSQGGCTAGEWRPVEDAPTSAAVWRAFALAQLAERAGS